MLSKIVNHYEAMLIHYTLVTYWPIIILIAAFYSSGPPNPAWLAKQHGNNNEYNSSNGSTHIPVETLVVKH